MIWNQHQPGIIYRTTCSVTNFMEQEKKKFYLQFYENFDVRNDVTFS